MFTMTDVAWKLGEGIALRRRRLEEEGDAAGRNGAVKTTTKQKTKENKTKPKPKIQQQKNTEQRDRKKGKRKTSENMGGKR